MKVIILYEFNTDIGHGHLMRSRSLYEFFLSNKIHVEIYESSKFKFNDTKDKKVYILDFYNNDLFNSWIPTLKTNNIVVTLDYFDSNYNPDCNFSVLEQATFKRNYLNFHGLEYLILRRDLQSSLNTSKNFNQILIYIGGNGHDDLVYDIVKNKIPSNYKCLLIRNGTSNLLNDLPSNIIQYQSPTNILELMSNSYIAITSPGLMALELLFLEVPSILIPLNGFHEKFIQFMEKEGLFLENLDNIDTISQNLVKKVIEVSKSKISLSGPNKILNIITEIYEGRMGIGSPLWRSSN